MPLKWLLKPNFVLFSVKKDSSFNKLRQVTSKMPMVYQVNFLFTKVFQYKQNNHFERKCWRYEGVDIGCVGSSSSLQKSRRTAPAAQAFHVSSEVLKAKMTCRMPIGRLVLCVTESFPFIKPKGPYLVTHVDHFCLSDYDDRGCVCVCNCVYLLVT